MKCDICGNTIHGEPYRTFGELRYCSWECWINVVVGKFNR